MYSKEPENEVYAMTLCYLCNLKNWIISSKGKEITLKTGYLASARYLDRAINTLMSQQTEIEDLKNQLEIEKDYSSAWGDFFGYTPDEMTEEERRELRKHMNEFERKWKSKLEEET